MNTQQSNQTFCILCTLPLSGCICTLAPHLTLPTCTHILFHPNEIQRRNSSGRLLKNCLKIESTTWHRLKNDILAQKFNGFALLYPMDQSAKTQAEPLNFEVQTTKQADEPNGYLWIDATWQESRKMLRQSPWLNNLPKYQINPLTSKNLPQSQYELRRNQTLEGLCTMETFAYWLDEKNQPKSARDLLNFFNQFQSAFLLARNSGLFK